MKPDYEKFLKECWDTGILDNAPHCDSRVLHTQNDCRYCGDDKYAILRKFREDNGISFTGGPAKNWPCPAEQARSLKDSINKWPGNTPKPHGCTCTYWMDDDNPCPIHDKR